jgi:hypothetical protein
MTKKTCQSKREPFALHREKQRNHRHLRDVSKDWLLLLSEETPSELPDSDSHSGSPDANHESDWADDLVH